MYYIVDSNKVSYSRKENIKKIMRKENIFIKLLYLLENKNVHVSGSLQQICIVQGSTAYVKYLELSLLHRCLIINSY